MMERPARSWKARASAVTAAAILAASAPAYAGPPDASPPAEAAAKAEAVARFDKGIALYDKGAWKAALAEFVEARRLYPLRNALYQAGLCFEKLQQYDEALERFEATLREYGDSMPAVVKESVQRKVVEMRSLVGEIAVDDAEPGATVFVDELARGEYPLLAAVRVAAGPHVVGVFKPGFHPSRARVIVAGRKTERVSAPLTRLGSSGSVRIAEQGGKALAVLIDGTPVGKTPWEGPLAAGPHMVLLRGEGNLGTPPVQLTVEAGRFTPLTLVAEQLDALLRVVPVPVNANVAIDGVIVGRGVWEGRLRADAHRIEASAEGFLPSTKTLTIPSGGSQELRAELQRDPRSPFWTKPRPPPHFVAEVAEAVAISQTFGGDVAGGCTEVCSEGPATGGYAVARLGYELPDRGTLALDQIAQLGLGLGLGVAAGYLALKQTTTQRSTAAYLGGSKYDVTADDVLRLRAGLVGGWVGLRVGTRFPVHVRLEAGALLGSMTDVRRGTVVLPSNPSVHFGPLLESHAARMAYFAYDLRFGLVLSRRVELTLGLTVLAVVAPSRPRWDDGHRFYLPGSGLATFYGDALTSPLMFVFAPGLGARYDLSSQKPATHH